MRVLRTVTAPATARIPKKRGRGHFTGAGTSRARALHGRGHLTGAGVLPVVSLFGKSSTEGLISISSGTCSTLNVTGEHNNPGHDTDVDNENSDDDE